MAFHYGSLALGMGNTKVGYPTFALTAGDTCKNCEHLDICYGNKIDQLRPNAKAMHDASTAAVRSAFVEWKDDLFEGIALLKPPVVRLNESGDFHIGTQEEDYAYFSTWMELALQYPSMMLQGMTCCYDTVLDWADAHNGLPENVYISFSESAEQFRIIASGRNMWNIPNNHIYTKQMKKEGAPHRGIMCPNQMQKEWAKAHNLKKGEYKVWQCADCHKHMVGCFRRLPIEWQEH